MRHSRIKQPRRVEVTYADAKEYRGPLDDLDPEAAIRIMWGLLTHRTDTSIVLVHDSDGDHGDVYASVIPIVAVKSCRFMETL